MGQIVLLLLALLRFYFGDKKQKQMSMHGGKGHLALFVIYNNKPKDYGEYN